MMDEEQFVFGDSDDSEPTEIESRGDAGGAEGEYSRAHEDQLVDRLRTPEKQATKRFTVDLNLELHKKLSVLSAQTGRSKADIVRELLRDVLQDIEA